MPEPTSSLSSSVLGEPYTDLRVVVYRLAGREAAGFVRGLRRWTDIGELRFDQSSIDDELYLMSYIPTSETPKVIPPTTDYDFRGMVHTADDLETVINDRMKPEKNEGKRFSSIRVIRHSSPRTDLSHTHALVFFVKE